MDTRILRHYETELAYLREMGGEFAASYPKIAARLGMEGTEVLDPYVERILEGVAFLSARVQLELELQFPAFTNHLLEIVYPHYLAPSPSMMIVAFEPDPSSATMDEGFTLPRETALRNTPSEGVQTACTFRTCADLTLWPLAVTEAEYIDGRGPLVAAGVVHNRPARAAIRLRLSRTDDGRIADMPIETLRFFLDGQDGNAWQLHEVLCAQVSGLTSRSTDRRDDWAEALWDAKVAPWGFDQQDALLPTPRQSFDGYRLLQEYFAMPQRFHFVELTGLSGATRAATGSDVDLYILLSESRPEIAPVVTPASFNLHAVPAINLFPKRCDRILLSKSATEHHLVADRTAPLDFEIHSVTSVRGISGEGEDDVIFNAFYSADDFTAAGESYPAYYTQNRRMRMRTERERLRGVRTTYLGSEMFLALVDRNQAPYSGSMSQVAVQAMVSNRDLPLLLSSGAPDLFHLADGGPVSRITTPVSPTRPRPSLAEGDTSWRLISHLSLNYLSIADTSQGGSAEALRELVGIYAPAADRVIEKQLEGIIDLTSRPIVRRMTDEVLSTAVRGLEINLTMDESAFEGTSVYLLGAVLERFFRKHVSINSFTETVLTTQQRGEIARWRPETGLGRLI